MFYCKALVLPRVKLTKFTKGFNRSSFCVHTHRQTALIAFTYVHAMCSPQVVL